MGAKDEQTQLSKLLKRQDNRKNFLRTNSFLIPALLFSLFGITSCSQTQPISEVDTMSVETVPQIKKGKNLLSNLPSGTWTDGDIVGDLRVVFAGGGKIVTNSSSKTIITLEPSPVTTPETTRAALVVSRKKFKQKCLTVASSVVTLEQLRTGSTPNAWEMAWLVWDYTDNEHFTYVVVKPNGWELGKRDPAYPGGQRFLKTGNTPIANPGDWGSWTIVRKKLSNKKTRTFFSISGKQITKFTDKERPYYSGSVGLYTEDAKIGANKLVVGKC